MNNNREEAPIRDDDLRPGRPHSGGPKKPTDWARAASLPSFRDLLATRRRIILPTLLFSVGFYLCVTLFMGFAPEAAVQPVIGSVNVGYLLIFAVYVVTWVSAILYVRFSGAVLDPKAANVVNDIHGQE